MRQQGVLFSNQLRSYSATEKSLERIIRRTLEDARDMGRELQAQTELTVRAVCEVMPDMMTSDALAAMNLVRHTDTGDSTATLAGLDPSREYRPHRKAAAAAYAGGRDPKDPLISPVYGIYRPGFPPTLITSGTRDLLLGDCARLSTALRLAGVDVHLHVWEGLWHVFEWDPEITEAELSLDEIAAFLGRHQRCG